MKSRKYTYKNQIPKQLKKRKSNSFKKVKEKISEERKIKKSLATPVSYKRDFSPFQKQKPYMIKRNRKSWKVPSLLFGLVLITIIIIIPTLIVSPFVSNETQQITSVESTPEVNAEEVSSPFSVSVMRSSSEEVENIPLEDYVIGVVASEMPVNFEAEALKAQGLAARTYIVKHLLYNTDNEKSDVTDTVEHQVYKSEEELMKQWGANEYKAKIEKIKGAVKATEGQIITYDDEPITPAFFSTSNGYTENSEDYWENALPYLKSVESTWDKESPKFLDQKTFTIAEINDALDVMINSEQNIPINIERTESNRVNTVQLGDKEFSGRKVREKLQLQSNDFTIEQNNDHFIFTTKGYGHGIGMSQYGANGMAQEGKTYEEIVKYYYKDIDINNILDVAPTLVAK